MPIFKFKAKNLEGKELKGSREALNRFALSKDLQKEGFTLIDFEEDSSTGGKRKKFNILSFQFGGIPEEEKILFTRNLAVMIGAGLALSKALNVLMRQTKNKKFKQIISEISTTVTKGKSLSESLANHKRTFSPLYVSMVRAGEKSGKLQESLKLLAGQMHNSYALKRKIKGAMVYPIIILVAMIGIGALLLVYVVPTLVSSFEDINVELPASTQFIVWLSNSLVANSLLLLGIFLALVFFVLFLIRQPAIKHLKDKVFLHLPLISPLIQKINSARTARTFSSLIDSGVDILEALDITANVLQNVCYRNVLKDARKKIQKGASISASFKKNEHIFPPLLGEMIAVGEETGQLSKTLLELAVFYEEEVAQATKNMATIIEPIMMIIIGAVVGFFAVAMMKPMYSMMGTI